MTTVVPWFVPGRPRRTLPEGDSSRAKIERGLDCIACGACWSACDVVTANALINAAGPWAPDVTEHLLRQPPAAHTRLIKGSHVVVPRLYEHDQAYIFQNADGRIVFAIPYEHDYTLIGTTDEDFRGDLSAPTASAAEVSYLCGAVSGYFRKGVTPDQVVHAYSGVRQLYDDGARSAQNLTREYLLDLDDKPREAPLLTVYGGKITTYRTLAEAALGKLAPTLRQGATWTADAPLPGGDFPHRSRQVLVIHRIECDLEVVG